MLRFYCVYLERVVWDWVHWEAQLSVVRTGWAQHSAYCLLAPVSVWPCSTAGTCGSETVAAVSVSLPD